MLVIPKPTGNNSFGTQVYRVIEPFTWVGGIFISLVICCRFYNLLTNNLFNLFQSAWALIIVMIIAAAFLSVWFTDRTRLAKERKDGRQVKLVYSRLALDSFLEKGIVSTRNNLLAFSNTLQIGMLIMALFVQFFCSAGIEHETGASLPYKVIIFLFGKKAMR